MTRLFATNITVNALNGAAATDLIVDKLHAGGQFQSGRGGLADASRRPGGHA